MAMVLKRHSRCQRAKPLGELRDVNEITRELVSDISSKLCPLACLGELAEFHPLPLPRSLEQPFRSIPWYFENSDDFHGDDFLTFVPTFLSISMSSRVRRDQRRAIVQNYTKGWTMSHRLEKIHIGRYILSWL